MKDELLTSLNLVQDHRIFPKPNFPRFQLKRKLKLVGKELHCNYLVYLPYKAMGLHVHLLVFQLINNHLKHINFLLKLNQLDAFAASC